MCKKKSQRVKSGIKRVLPGDQKNLILIRREGRESIIAVAEEKLTVCASMADNLFEGLPPPSSSQQKNQEQEQEEKKSDTINKKREASPVPAPVPILKSALKKPKINLESEGRFLMP